MASYPEGISLVQFANNTTFFMEGLVEEARNLPTLLDLFADFLPMQLNRAKSTFVEFGLLQDEMVDFSTTIGVPTWTTHMHYLGLSLMRDQILSTNWLQVIKKVERRLKG